MDLTKKISDLSVETRSNISWKPKEKLREVKKDSNAKIKTEYTEQNSVSQ